VQLLRGGGGQTPVLPLRTPLVLDCRDSGEGSVLSMTLTSGDDQLTSGDDKRLTGGDDQLLTSGDNQRLTSG